jgi:hypothetical protein
LSGIGNMPRLNALRLIPKVLDIDP